MERVKLGDIATIVMGQSPSSSDTNTQKNGLPFYQGVAEFGEIYPRPIKFCSKPKKIAEKGDILIGVRAPVGDINLAVEECCIGRGLAAIRPFKGMVNRDYLYYFLRSKKLYLETKSTGSTFKAINKSVLSNIFLPLDNTEKQYELANILKKAEVLIRKRKAQIEALDDLVQSLFYELLDRPNLKEQEVGTFIKEIVAGKSFAGKEKSDYRVLKTSCLFTGHFNEDEWKYYPSDYIPSERYIIKNNDILVSRMNTQELVGAAAYVFKDYYDLAVPDRIWILKTKNIANIYLWKYFQTEYYRNEINRISTGTSGSMKNISKKKFSTIHIKVPPIELQNKFANQVLKIEKEKDKLRASLKELQTLFDALMQEAFSGNLV